MKKEFNIGIFQVIRTTPYIVSILFLGGCSNFDPTPYQRAREMTELANTNNIEYQREWHKRLVQHINLLEEQYISLLIAKLEQETMDNLIKGNDAYSAETQDVLFPVQGNRTLERRKANNNIKNVINQYTFDVDIGGSIKNYSLIEMHLEELSNSSEFQKLTVAQKRLYDSGIAILRTKVVDVPVISIRREEFSRLRSIIDKHANFDIELSEKHKEFEVELIGALQSAASALESSAWLASIGNKTLGSLNSLVDNEANNSNTNEEESNGSEQAK
ncbi:hypothetical protein [Rubellicoccus peritrichatus]|uniref:Lipoprotein n=1 Tax=Rubellicoccus peritrichatus TaxID=3080537 RepID=A0AAQ3QUF4_9BACT|nr:hypothetical protein [Puniceicoccus sp. CR14]WOO39647.1 hypothetical protein RZN69_13570 [Puniceicoccus sp. CR14]